jgi:hypothetical protein
MAVNVFLTFNTKDGPANVRKLERWYPLLCYGIPAVPALTYLLLDLNDKTDFYGNATVSRQAQNPN